MKQLKDLKITSVEYLHPRFVLIKLKSDEALPEIKPGQFVEVRWREVLQHSYVALFLLIM